MRWVGNKRRSHVRNIKISPLSPIYCSEVSLAELCPQNLILLRGKQHEFSENNADTCIMLKSARSTFACRTTDLQIQELPIARLPNSRSYACHWHKERFIRKVLQVLATLDNVFLGKGLQKFLITPETDLSNLFPST